MFFIKEREEGWWEDSSVNILLAEQVDPRNPLEFNLFKFGFGERLSDLMSDLSLFS